MSLNWQFTDKARFAALSEDERKVNYCYVYGCLFVDMGTITEKNAAEWRERYVLANKKVGPFYTISATGKPWVPSLADVQKRIGLQTNVSTKSRSYFEKKVAKTLKERAVRS